jgi:hypothetical protein
MFLKLTGDTERFYSGASHSIHGDINSSSSTVYVQLLKIHRILCNYIFVSPFTLTLHVSALDGHHQVFILPQAITLP